MIFIYNLSAYSILCVCNGLVNLLTIRFCLNRRIHLVILNDFLYMNLLVMFVMKRLWLSSVVAMATIICNFQCFHLCIFGPNNYWLCWPVFFFTYPTWSLIPKLCQPFYFNVFCAKITWIFFSWDVLPISLR